MVERDAITGRIDSEGKLVLSRWSQASEGDTFEVDLQSLRNVLFEALVPGQLMQADPSLNLINVTPLQVNVGNQPYAVGSLPRGNGGELEMEVCGVVHYGTADPDASVGRPGDLYVKEDADGVPLELWGRKSATTNWNDANGNPKKFSLGESAVTETVDGGLYIGAGDRSGITGTLNVLIGRNTGISLVTGTRNTVIGTDAGPQITGDDNVLLGRSAGNTITTGSYNTCIGRGAGSGVTTEDNGIYIRSGPGGTDQIVFDGTNYFLPSLPTTDPGVSGALWNDAGTMKVSA